MRTELDGLPRALFGPDMRPRNRFFHPIFSVRLLVLPVLLAACSWNAEGAEITFDNISRGVYASVATSWGWDLCQQVSTVDGNAETGPYSAAVSHNESLLCGWPCPGNGSVVGQAEATQTSVISQSSITFSGAAGAEVTSLPCGHYVHGSSGFRASFRTFETVDYTFSGELSCTGRAKAELELTKPYFTRPPSSRFSLEVDCADPDSPRRIPFSVSGTFSDLTYDTWSRFQITIRVESYDFRDEGVRHDASGTAWVDASLEFSATPAIDLSVVSAEVAQVVFDPDINGDGSVDLVQGREAVVCATVAGSDIDGSDAREARVHLELNGATVGDPVLVPLNEITSDGIDLCQRTCGTAPCPVLSFTPSSTGNAVLKVVIEPPSDIDDRDDTNDFNDTSIEIKATRQLNLLYVPMTAHGTFIPFRDPVPYPDPSLDMGAYYECVDQSVRYIDTLFPTSGTSFLSAPDFHWYPCPGSRRAPKRDSPVGSGCKVARSGQSYCGCFSGLLPVP